jgi:ribosome-associated protein
MTNGNLLTRIAQIIYDKKGSNTLTLDVRGHSNITDYVIIAEGNIDRHVVAIGRAIIDELEKEGIRVPFTDGLQSGDWVVLDLVGVMVHLFTPSLREKYALHKLWPQSEIVDLEVKVTN